MKRGLFFLGEILFSAIESGIDGEEPRYYTVEENAEGS